MANNKAFKIKNGLLAGRYLGSNGTETAGTVGNGYTSTVYSSTSFSVASQENNPYGPFFKPDGTKLYVIGITTDTVYQYTLSTAWDVSTASYDSKSYSVSSQETTPRSLYIKSDGLKMYVFGDATDTIYQYTLSTAWDISTASYDSVSKNVSSEAVNGTAITLNANGTSLYLAEGDQYVTSYTLSTAWNISTASSPVVHNFSSQDTSAFGISFNSDGTIFVLNGGTNDKFYFYTLSTPYDLSTATYTNSSYSWTSVDTAMQGIFWGDSNKRLFSIGRANDSVYDFSTVSNTQSLDLSTGNTFSFTPSGATTVSFTNPPASGTAIGFTLEVINTGGYTLTWPSSVKWHLATTPTATATKEVYAFITTDGGTTYYGKRAGENLA